MRELRDDAVVLRTYRTGESDRTVVLWTRAHGKVRVLAKGARRSSSRLGGSLEVLGYVRVDLVATRGEFFVARHVEHLDPLATLRSAYERINAGYAVVEIVDAIPAEDVADEGIFELLVRVLSVLDDAQFDPALVPAAFALRLLALDGSAPVLDECVNCGRAGPLVAFDAQVGGVLCANCRSGRSLSPEGLTLMRRLVGGDLGGALRERDPAGGGEVAAIATESIEQHFGRRLKAARSSPPLAGPRSP